MRLNINDILNYIPNHRQTSFNRGTYIIQNLLFILLMFLGAIGVWAQTDYSGTYYIGSRGYNQANPTNNYYLCPTEGWAFYVATNNVQGGDNGQPFLTTYKCRNGVYDATKAVWHVEKDYTSGCYYIKQASTGKYLVSNGVLPGAGSTRARVHLETVADAAALAALGDWALFEINYDNDHYDILPHSAYGRDGNNIYLVVNTNNYNQLNGNEIKKNGPNGFKNCGGIIGLYTHPDDGNAYFYFENALSIDLPTITNNFDGTFTITAADGATIYYTTDGTTPTTSTTTTETSGTGTTSVTVSGIAASSDVRFIKAIAKSTSDEVTAVRTYSLPVLDRPVITVVNNVVTITAADGATIFYTTDDTEATPSSTPYSIPFTLSSSAVRAIATKPGYYRSSEALSYPPTTVHSSSEITDMTRSYLLASDFTIDTTPIGTKAEPFKGTIDGQLKQYTFTNPLVGYADGAIIRNVILESANISSGNDDHHLGAIACTAKGDSRIYNCGILAGALTESGHVGGIVGHLDEGSRVINCYSYATVSGGSDVAGIVGYNNGNTSAGNIKTMVMNCMFYGDITSGGNVSPVYGGNIISNLPHVSDRSQDGLNTFNYYAYEKLKTTAITAGKYNCALAVKDDYLNRFEFYRLLLNSNKKLAAYYATGDTANANQMAKWVLETADRTIDTPMPYPVLKAQGKYPSIINYDVEHAPSISKETNGRPVETDRNLGGNLGTLSVTINQASNAPTGASITRGSLTLTRTDKDPEHFNFNYDKVQLPYYNDVGTKNYTGGKVVTGWKITAISSVAGDPYTSSHYPTTGVKDYPYHNYADRKSSNKDLYSVSGRVFSQGAYFDVPYGVTSITIEPYWGNAAYISDANYDVIYDTSYGRQEVTQLGTQATNDSEMFPGLNGQKVYTSVGTALGSLSGSTVYDNAIVLVGNLHLNGVPSNGTKPFTMMSIDWDKDNEPDYSMIYHHSGRTPISPIRFDFLNIPGTAQAQKPKDTETFLNFTIFLTKGWFETTNTCLVYSNQVEYENKDEKKNKVTKTDAPLILLGGDFEQFVSTQSSTVDGKTPYIHVGSNVRIQSFGLGTHGDGSQNTPHIPVSVTGGEYEGFYLSGTYNQDVVARENDNAECYISGGHFVEAAGASQEQIDGSVHWQIYDADMDAFYGGGVNAAKPITGDVTVDIFNSHVGVYCGGPKFGDMQTGKKVLTNAEGCTFTKYFGAGYGGTSYSRKKYYDVKTTNWSGWQGKYTTDRGKYFDGATTNSKNGGGTDAQYGKKGIGVATDVDYEFFAWSSGETGGRFYVKFASFSLATCNDVESNLKGCTIKENFYGGGSYGEVLGTAKSVLDGCMVNGNVFGGGYSATLPTVKVRMTPAFTTNPNINRYSGMFEPGVLAGFEPIEFEWKKASDFGKTLTDNNSGSDMVNHYLYTNVDLTALGKVGYTDLTVKNNCQITGSVYGGGDESAVNQNTLVKIQNEGETEHITNVYGGGNIANVLGNAEVNLTSGTVSQDVYGGGRGETTIIGGDVTVNIGARTGEAPSFTYTGTGIVQHDVYGGSALGSVNTTSGETKVNIYSGTINGSVYGGGLGDLTSLGSGHTDIAALNFGNTTITIENSNNANAWVKTGVYGGSNINGVLKGSSTVTITGGTVGTTPVATPIPNVVFGGGLGQPTLVNGDIEVNIGNEGQASGGALIYGHVYGGSALGNVNASKNGSDPMTFDDTKHTNVSLYKGTIHGNVYGGGLGQKNGVNEATSDIESYVGGPVNVLLDGAQLICTFTGTGANRMPLSGQIFGANNLNGTPKGHVKVHVKRTVGTDKTSEEALAKTRDQRGGLSPYSYDVAAVYGGGNQADYIPTDATLTLPDPSDEHYEEKYNKKNNACAEVLIEGCDETSIEYVYGGGNAAAVPATDVTILGTYIIDYVFGGGNGKSTDTFTNPGANIGSYNNGATGYGSGKAITKLVGGHIRYVFGGSNTLGNVRGGTSLSMPDASLYPTPTYKTCCTERDIKEIYGAGNQADQDGPVTMILGCVDNMDYVYGGARNAHVKGGVDLVVTSGHFLGVFGGNDTAGSIQGPITLTIEETGCKPLVIDNLYLGGNNAAYSIYGYKNTGTVSDPVLVARNKAEYDALTTEEKTAEGLPYADPVLNVISCTSIGNVFGGGLGATATMHGSPTVNINLIKGNQAGLDEIVQLPKTYENIPNISKIADVDANTISCKIKDEIGSIGNVYGGGSAASVMGDTHVNICTEENVALRSNNGAPITGTPTPVLGATITGNVFGAGYGQGTVVDSTFVVIANGTVGKSVYGGGELGAANGNSHITISGGAIGDSTGANAGATYGNVYGGGKGFLDIENFTTKLSEHLSAGHVMGNTYINISGGNIYHNIYGGGAYGSVGTYDYDSGTGVNTRVGDTGTANITITGGTIGIDGKENGMVFGSSRGDVAVPSYGSPAIDPNNLLAWVYDTNVTIGTTNDETPGPAIKGSVYGSGENGHTFNETHVTIHSGTIGLHDGTEFDATRGNVYGGGCGTDQYWIDANSNETEDAGELHYNPMAGIVNGTTTVLIDGGSVTRNVYGGGAMGSVGVQSSVAIGGTAVIGYDGTENGDVFAAARGDEAITDDALQAYVGASALTISGTSTIKGSAFGGGQNGIVKGAVTVNMTGGTVKNDVYGGGALANTNTDNWVTDHIVYAIDAVETVTGLTTGTSPVDGYFTRSGAAEPYTYTPATGKAADATTYYRILKATSVTMTGGTIEGNLYGGGLGRQAAAGPPAVEAIAANVYGPTMVTMSGGQVNNNVFGCNNINGAPHTAATVIISNGTITHNVYGGGNVAPFTGNTNVTMSGGTADYVYGGGYGPGNTAIITGDTRVAISGTANIGNNVYGGGSEADVTGNVNVIVSGGSVYNDVYGGGALANTNTANWNFTTPTSIYLEIANITYPSYSPKEDVKAGDVVTGLYTRSGDTYTLITKTEPETTADGVTTYYVRHPGSSVDDLYTRSGEVYSPASGEAVTGTTYYEKRDLPGTWAEGKSSTDNTTTVTLIGGVIGNAYGGGLGDPTHPVYVCGDVLVSVNDPLIIGSNTGVAFTKRNNEHVTIDGDDTEYVVPITGRVFGCNNIKGTPLGDVHVNIYSTRQLDESGNVVPHVNANSHVPEEIQAVYGGGNQANYVPATGKGTHVTIDGCDKTTILKVYGGGSSASVPASDVLIKAALDIGFAFGGGNGGEKVYDYATGKWKDNDGASVNGLSKIDCQGGKIGQVFGGSDNKGNCLSTSVTQNPQGDCDLIITRLYGAGNEADVTGNVNIVVSGCTAGNTEIEYICGGSYNAHITGDVTLTITSGFFKSVYGGNEATGSIGGHITVNIEETDDCKPIIIGNLVGGGNMAPYPGTKRDGTKITTPGKITLNVKSATRIDNIYGGGYGAEVVGDTKVNINMRKGYWAGKTYTPTGETYPDAIGKIGNVFGGGNAGRVKGNTEVNIGTSTTVQIMKRNASGKLVDSSDEEIYDPSGNFNTGKSIASIVMLDKPVLGANITGNVFGGGNMADVTGNSTVNIGAVLADDPETEAIEYTTPNFADVDYPAKDEFGHDQAYAGIKIGGSVYGGGNIGSVGSFNYLNTAKPTALETASTGSCTVTIGYDAEIGPAAMPTDFLSGYAYTTDVTKFMKERFIGHVFGGCKGSNNIAADANVEYKSWANKTNVIIANNAFVKGSVYGGAENGHVLADTYVQIDGGQIGCGAGQTAPYGDLAFIDPLTTEVTDENKLAECPHWVFGRVDSGTTKDYKPYDPFAGSYDSKGGATFASDGHTYYGNVYGGGSGAFPYAAGKWLDSAGQVYGNTKVTITGGHILTSIYGGNEMTNVLGDSCVVIMRGGTLGVPRTLSQIAAHPVTCYLFGAGKGDTRTLFNTWTNVKNTRVHVGGTAKIYGSVFGGGEDGHVLENVKLGIYGGSIGTTGTSYVDGNVFGGGRGYTGNALTAGSVHGNVNIAIAGGTMLGSVYGGGRLASVGINMVDATLPNGSPNPEYGLLNDDTAGNQYGHITINISGGTIGNSGATGDGAKYSGNVFGGSMGRLTQPDGETLNPLWPKLAVVKLTDVTINGTAHITRNVYGGGEYGVVRNGSEVTIDGNSIVGGNVFGGGYGSNRTEKQTIAVVGYDNTYYTFTPMAWAGCVSGNTKVNIRGGWVKTNVYGGGEYASVGLIDFVSNASGDFTNMTKHDNPENGFALSWPYEFHYHAAAPNDLPAVGGGSIGGKATVEVTGGRIGITGKDYRGSGYKEDGVTPLTEAEKKAARTDNGDIYGGSKGLAGDRYDMALCANVKETEVIINYSSPKAKPENYTTGADVSNKGSNDCIAGSVYGGGENGHVIENANVTLTDGLIGHAIYGGGKGKDKYHPADLKNFDGTDNTEGKVYSITAGKVYGNTTVTMTGGYVVRNIYGGGNMASVGKGNYAGGSDDYTTGYGEKITTALWSNTDFTGSGKATVSITGGQVGYIDSDPSKSVKDDLPYGNVYGGCRGQGAAEVSELDKNPDFYVGFVNETDVTIGTAGALSSNPRIYGSVYGGGQDGHVRRDTKVTINNGEIGAPYTSTEAANTLLKTTDINNQQWLHRGNVYGGGSGIGKYEFNYDGINGTWTDANGNDEYDEGEENSVTTAYGTLKEIGFSSSAGSVTRNTTVDIKGGTIHRNVYGGGSLASVLPPGWTMSAGPYTDAANGKVSVNTLNITGGTIGNATDYGFKYGGNVFGASRGMENADINSNYFAISTGTQVNIQNVYEGETLTSSPAIHGNVYGGGEMGIVKQNTNVQLTGGIIDHDVYGGGKGTKRYDNSEQKFVGLEANVGGDVTVELNKGVGDAQKGCTVSKIFGCNDLNGTPKGHVLVHVHATQHVGQNTVLDKVPSYHPNQGDTEGYIAYLTRLVSEAKPEGTPLTGIDVTPVIAAQTFLDSLATAGTTTESQLVKKDTANIIIKANALITALEAIHEYDVLAVYGGGDLAAYEPAKAGDFCEVIIEGCQTTSIKEVYGGGNAASTPANQLKVKECFLINEAFGGGNGKDNYMIDGKWFENPGANVGYHNYYHYTTSGGHGDGTLDTDEYRYESITNDDATSKDDRITNYRYGTGIAQTEIVGGRIRNVYGGSNKKGNICTMALSQYEESGTCPLFVGVSYGAGKDALIDGDVSVEMGCTGQRVESFFGGAKNADMNSGVTLNITNGTFGKIFGGNDLAGTINGPITINIEEKGCKPIIINELYGGGFYAPYSVYGYQKDGSGNFVTREEDDPTSDNPADKIQSRIPLKKGESGALTKPHRDPQINIISATKIKNIYGGGYQALVIGSPHVNVNMNKGKVLAKYANAPETSADFTEGSHGVGDDAYVVDSHPTDKDAILAIGEIGTIFGGGNEADIIGNTYVDIGTGKWLNSEGIITTEDAEGKTYTYKEKTSGVWKWYDVNEDEVASEPVPYRKAAIIKGSVYGGGKMGHVGDFTKTDGKPTSCADGTGNCYVTISNGEIGPNDMKMTAAGGPDDAGHVFGAGQGKVDDPDVDATVDYCAYSNNTEVVINGDAFIKGSVYGGSENGHVLGDTHVTIDGDCQIGNGWDSSLNAGAGGGINQRYTDYYAADIWTNRTDYPTLPECASWPYGIDTNSDGKLDTFQPHDKFADAGGGYEPEGAVSASDGHTFYGNVFGGGSGYYPYAAGKWLKKAGWVEGNTLVEIKGGHVLTSIYGGNEMTNVGTGLSGAGGKCTVRMTGGTLGVPRSLAQIAAHPVTCYLFGAGKGDQNIHFNKDTNVKEVEVEVTGGTIFGSVFGGGEDGHVLGDVKMTIGNDDGTGPTIGTWGTSYVDGNVFGGGRGYSGEAFTAGNVGGSIDLDIKGGTILGSVYGGGRLGSVGYGLYNVEEANYGVMLADNVDEFGTTTTYYTTTGMNKKGRGNIDINISGGTIGNTNEFKYIAPDVTGAALTTATANMPNTLLESTTDKTNNRLKHTKGGNVFAGGMGRRTALDGSTLSNWYKLGNAKSTKLTIGGTAWIMGNVYGGGEFGAVTGSHDTKNTANVDIKAGTEIIINGGTIGTEITETTPVKATIATPVYNKDGDTPSAVKYTFGSVYGGGYGTEEEIASITLNTHVDKLGALVTDSTYINMTTGLVRASVFGGGEIAAVGGSTNVNISGGEIGRNEVKGKSTDDPGYVMFGSYAMGNVFGGGKGTSSHTLVGVVKGNTTINITQGTRQNLQGDYEPFIYHNVYGGGAYASVGTFDFSDGETGWMSNIPKGIPLNWTTDPTKYPETGTATVNIKGGTIGISGRDNGMVNGSSRGDVAKPIRTLMDASPLKDDKGKGYVDKDPYDKMGWVERSIVTIGDSTTIGPHIKGSVYGGGENGHVFTHATVNMMKGTIGVLEDDTWYDFGDDDINKAAWTTRGNIYGAGCGTDTYTGDDGKKHLNSWAGCVIGNTNIKISGGLVTQNVYGGGSMGSVGRIDETKTTPHTDAANGFKLSWPVGFAYQDLTVEDPVENTHSTGKATINIYGGRIGTTGSDNGDVFGGTRGDAGPSDKIAQFGNVRTTAVNINYTNPATGNDLSIVENVEEGSKKFSLRVNEGVNAITGSVYGGSENGHVNEDTKVKVENGLIGHAIYGGGKGKGKYETKLWKIGTDPSEEPDSTATIYSMTAGKVYGNTTIEMSGGHVIRNIYGGGNLGSIGKGNYAGGNDDYSTHGYGEKVTDLWKNADFINSGKTTVSITGGTVGFGVQDNIDVYELDGSNKPTLSGTLATLFPSAAAEKKTKLIKVFSKDDLPTGNVFGGCRGESARNVDPTLSPRWKYLPEFYSGYVNESNVTIGKSDGSSGPILYGSVYGGGQDGHVRRSTNVTIHKGVIGIPYNTFYEGYFGTNLDDLHWLHRGNVYGSGSGIGQYKDSAGKKQYSNSSGSVTDSTTVTVNSGINGESGGIIYRNVYGGGSLATVGPPAIYSDQDIAGRNWSVCTVNIAGTVGVLEGYKEEYGGEVYGASRGIPGLGESFATTIWTKVHIMNGAHIMGNVFGGGDAGPVKKDSEVVVGGE